MCSGWNATRRLRAAITGRSACNAISGGERSWTSPTPAAPGRHLEVVQNINVVPDGAKFLDINPQNRNPQNPTQPLPDDFLRPFLGYSNINIRSHFGTSEYHALQVQLNRRYIRGLQFAAAYTFGTAKGIADEDEATISAVRPVKEWNYSPSASSQEHNLVVNYTWDVPGLGAPLEQCVRARGLRQLAAVGENAFVSGDWAPIVLGTTDTFDFTGGTGGVPGANGSDVGGGVRTVRPVVLGPLTGGNSNARPNTNTDGSGSWINWASVGAAVRARGLSATRRATRSRCPGS